AHKERAVTDLHWLSAAEISAAYAAHHLSPVELVQTLLDRIATHNGRICALIGVDAEKALDAARHAEKEIFGGRARGPLHGVPIGIKDNIDIAGLPTTCNSKILRDNIAREDARVIGNLSAA